MKLKTVLDHTSAIWAEREALEMAGVNIPQCILLATSAFHKALFVHIESINGIGRPLHCYSEHFPVMVAGLHVVINDESIAYPNGKPWRIVTAKQLARGVAVVDLYGLAALRG